MASPAQTLSFSESTNTFDSFLSYHAENMCYIGNLLVTFDGGDMYTHDSDTYNQFYGVDYPSYIKVVFNQNPTFKKSFVALTEGGNTVFACPEIQTQVMSYGTTPQQSNLVEEDFDDEEGEFIAALLGDSNSQDGLINGDSLKGKYIIIKFYKTSASELVVLDYAQIKTIDSALNVR